MAGSLTSESETRAYTMNTTLIPTTFNDALSFTMTHHNPRIVSLHDSNSNMYIAERLIHTSQVNNTFLHGYEPCGQKITGLHVLECFFLKRQEEKRLELPDIMQQRLDSMENFAFAVSRVVQKETESTPPFGLVDIGFELKWTLNGEPGECAFELQFVCISPGQFQKNSK